MTNYRCVFIYAGGNTTIEVTAGSAEHAIEVAGAAVSAGDYDRAEVWEDNHLLLTKATQRAWGLLGESAPSANAEAGPAQPYAQLSPSHPRRASSPQAAGLKGIGIGPTNWRNKAGRKG